MNNVVRIKAGPLPHADNRAACRLSHDVIGELIQAGSHRRNALAANHTRTPAEREFATYDRDPKARAWFWRAVFFAYAAIVGAAIYFR